VNAGNIDKDVEWIMQNKEGYDVEVIHESNYYGEIAVQGPESEAVIESVLGIPCAELAFYTFKQVEHEGETIIISRTGYTGEDGFEIYASHDLTCKLWDQLMDSGKAVPCGLGCRDTLRFEVGLPLYGDELSEEITPIEACLGIFVKTDKEEFIGKDVVKKQKDEGAPRKLVGIELHDKAIPRHGYEVLSGEEVIGYVTTGYRCISVEKSVALALIDSKYANMGDPVKIKIRKKVFDGTIVARKFYKKSYKK
jgi:aminomethyltransferase